jgi:ABC-type polysaccharide/polyol phosphate transport system ATPase subunit
MADENFLIKASQSMQHALQRAAFGLEEDGHPGAAETAPKAQRAAVLAGPPVIEVRDLNKSFRIPRPAARSAAYQLRHPARSARYRELHSLRGISFEVHQGEFFGIVGRNGSGKSTLLKILASIYRADGGRVRVAGRLAPFIELGVGLNPELTARENVVLGGVMMGLSRRAAAMRLDAVLDFAELHEFVDLKLKNYSSGMTVRLAFALMVQMDADIMLIDEVLAVGDASFAEKCLEVFRQRRRAGRTVVLVTHDMMTVQSFCHRAMLLHDGEQRYLGEPEEAVLRYYRLNLGGEQSVAGDERPGVRLLDVWLEDAGGARIENPAHGEPFSVHLHVEAREPLADPSFHFQVLNVDEVAVCGFATALRTTDGEPRTLAAGERVRLALGVPGRFVPGRYSLLATISRGAGQGDAVLHDVRVADFLIMGSDPRPGMVSVRADVHTEVLA